MPNIFETCSSALNLRPPLRYPTGLAPMRGIGQSARALDWAFSPDGDAQLGIALTTVAVTLWVRLSLFAECRERARTALARARDHASGDERVAHAALGGAGLSLMYGEGGPRARPILEATLELADRLDDKDFRLRALWGFVHRPVQQRSVRQGARARRSFHRSRREFIRQDRPHAGGPAHGRCAALSRRPERGADPIDRVNASLHVLAEKAKDLPARLADIDAVFPRPHPVAAGSCGSGPGARRRNIHEGRANGHALTFCSVLGQAAARSLSWPGGTTMRPNAMAPSCSNIPNATRYALESMGGALSTRW